MEVCVLGAGYVGLVTAVHVAVPGRHVRVYDPNPARIGPLIRGQVPIHEPGLQKSVTAAVRAGLLSAHDNPEEALAGSDTVLVCVGTPLDANGEADLAQVISACGLAVSSPEAVVIIRSTLPLGSSRDLSSWLGRTTMNGVASNPEFLRQGTAMQDVREPTRIVIGTASGTENAASETVRELYDGIAAPVIVTDFETAEMIKNAANAFLAAKLSFVNEMADLCEAYGADVDQVMYAIGLDPRIGASYLRPGIGFGGSCLPKELANLASLGRQRGRPLHLVEAAGESNDRRAARIVDRLEAELGSLHASSVALLGMAFKPETDDVRYSPALSIARELIARGCTVRAHDPAAFLGAERQVDGLDRVDTAEDAISGADLVVLATEWPEYSRLPWAELAKRARLPVVYDGRRLLDADDLRRDGWRVMRVGEATERQYR
jgi:UDPglucose 6-dehydrogenase